MDYDFASICAQQSFDFKKKADKLNDNFIDNITFALNVINDAQCNEKRSEIMVELHDILNDVAGQCEIFYIEALNKCKRIIESNL